MKQQAEIRELKVNRYVIIDEEPCKITDIQTSKPGKHGEAKARIEAVGIFDNRKRSIVHPVTHKVYIPMIDKRSAQLVALNGKHAQLMDMDTYEMFELDIDDEELLPQLSEGKEVLFLEALGRRKITRP